MGWSLDMVAKEYADRLKSAGLHLNVQACVLVTGEVAVRLPTNGKTDEYRRIFKAAVQKAEADKKAKLQEKQIKLL